jgi:hypothetical protein
MRPSDFYVKNIVKKFGYFASWFPNSPIQLGDVGVMEGPYFKQLTSLKELQLSFVPRTSKKSANFSYSWEADFAIDSNASVNIANVGITSSLNVKFNNAGAFVFETTDCTITEIENKISLGLEIKKMFIANTWEVDWVVIDSIVAAGSSTIIISNSNNSEIQLSASGELSKINLTDANLGLKIKNQTGEITKFLADKGLVPMFKTSKIKLSFLQRITKDKENAHFGGKVKRRKSKNYSEKEIWESTLK